MSLNLSNLNCFNCNSPSSSPESPKTSKPSSNIDLKQDNDSFIKESISSKESSPQIIPISTPVNESLANFSLTLPPKTYTNDNNKSFPENPDNTIVQNPKHLSLDAFSNASLNPNKQEDSAVFLTSKNNSLAFNPTHNKSNSTVSTDTFGVPTKKDSSK